MESILVLVSTPLMAGDKSCAYRSSYKFMNFLITYGILILDIVNCVRWHSNGSLLASVDRSSKVALSDFTTGKLLHTEVTADGSKLIKLHILDHLLITRCCSVSLLRLESSRYDYQREYQLFKQICVGAQQKIEFDVRQYFLYFFMGHLRGEE